MPPELISALIAALVGGVVGTGITAWVSLRLAWLNRRETAAAALWQYHFALAARALQAEVFESEPGPFSESSLMRTSRKELQEALREAYPYAGYLDNSTRKELFRRPRVFDNSAVAEAEEAMRQDAVEYRRLADALEVALESRFPRRRWWEMVRDRFMSGAKR